MGGHFPENATKLLENEILCNTNKLSMGVDTEGNLKHDYYHLFEFEIKNK